MVLNTNLAPKKRRIGPDLLDSADVCIVSEGQTRHFIRLYGIADIRFRSDGSKGLSNLESVVSK